MTTTEPRNFAAELAAARAAEDWVAHARIWDERSGAEVAADEASIASTSTDELIRRVTLAEAAPALLAAAVKLLKASDEGDADLAMDGYDELRTAVAKATGAAA